MLPSYLKDKGMISNKTHTITKQDEITDLIYNLKFSLVDSKATYKRCRNFIYKKNHFSFLLENKKEYIILNGNKLEIDSVFHKERCLTYLIKGV